MKRHRHLVANRTVWSNLIVVSTPSLAFSLSLVETEEPVRVQTLAAELAVEALDEGVVRRLARSAEVESDVMHEGPQVELLADELRSVVEPDCFWIANFGSSTIEHGNDVTGAPALLHFD